MTNIPALHGSEAEFLLNHVSNTFPKGTLHLPGPDFIDRVVAASDRKPGTLLNFQQIFNNGRLAGTGYVSILPVDQGVEHSAGASFAPNPAYFDPENIVKAVRTAVINKRAGGMGLISGRKAFQRPMSEGVELLHAIQDVYLSPDVGIA
jgi:class I fructose-bisphosphate aldolase